MAISDLPLPSFAAVGAKGVLACEAVPKVEGGWSGQAAEIFFWEAQILCVISPISA